MLATMQPDRLHFGQGRADGSGANAALGQVGDDARDQVGARVGVVNGATGVDHHAVCIGQNGKVAGVDDGARQVLQHGGGYLGKTHMAAGLQA